MVVCHALLVNAKRHLDSWIVDSGATCNAVVELRSLKESIEVTLGDGCTLEAADCGTIALRFQMEGQRCVTK